MSFPARLHRHHNAAIFWGRMVVAIRRSVGVQQQLFPLILSKFTFLGALGISGVTAWRNWKLFA